MKAHRVVNRIVAVLLAVAAAKLLQGQHAIDAALRENIGRQARLELRLARLNAEAVLARQRHDALSARVDRIDSRR